MDLAKDDLRTVIEDARTRHAAVVALIYFTDRQAMGLLRLYGTLAVATTSATAAGFAPDPIVGRPFVAAVAAATIVLMIGCIFCLLAMASGRINLPGRGADFWLWSLTPSVDRPEVLRSYLESMKERAQLNDDLNSRTAGALRRAKQCAIVAPMAAMLAGLAGALCA